MKNTLISTCLALLLTLACIPVAAQNDTLTLQDCRSLALKSNTNYKISQEKVQESEALRKMALAQFFPKATANGAYFWNEKNAQLLSGEQQNRINNMGTTITQDITDNLPSFIPSSWRNDINSILVNRIATPLNGIGSDITDALNFDLSQVWAGAISVYQPIYLGGKLRAMYRSAKALSDISALQADKAQEDLMISVDEAYWRVISLQQKQALAQQYCNLLDTLCNNIQAMVDAEVATLGDLAKVRVKLNEAQISLAKANSGLALSKMLLMQICGLPLDADFAFDEPALLSDNQTLDSINMQEVFANRTELAQLRQAGVVADAAVSIARSAVLPNLLAHGSYVVTNPSIFNGYQSSFDGMYSVGAVLNVPLCHPGAFYAIKAAKHRRNQVQMQQSEAQEKITLQVNKLNYELGVANAKLIQTQSNIEQAEENLKLAQESFAAGMISSSDLLQAQTAWMQANSEQLDASIEARMCYLYLQQALGH